MLEKPREEPAEVEGGQSAQCSGREARALEPIAQATGQNQEE